jgi:hypothetical protein
MECQSAVDFRHREDTELPPSNFVQIVRDRLKSRKSCDLHRHIIFGNESREADRQQNRSARGHERRDSARIDARANGRSRSGMRLAQGLRLCQGGSVMSVPPWPSLAMTMLDAMYWPSIAILAMWLPSVALNVPPVLLPLGV